MWVIRFKATSTVYPRTFATKADAARFALFFGFVGWRVTTGRA